AGAAVGTDQALGSQDVQGLLKAADEVGAGECVVLDDQVVVGPGVMGLPCHAAGDPPLCGILGRLGLGVIDDGNVPVERSLEFFSLGLALAVRHDGCGQLHLSFLSLTGMRWHTASRSKTTGSEMIPLATRASTTAGTPGWDSEESSKAMTASPDRWRSQEAKSLRTACWRWSPPLNSKPTFGPVQEAPTSWENPWIMVTRSHRPHSRIWRMASFLMAGSVKSSPPDPRPVVVR